MRQPPGRAQRRSGGGRKPREERWSELIEVAKPSPAKTTKARTA